MLAKTVSLFTDSAISSGAMSLSKPKKVVAQVLCSQRPLCSGLTHAASELCVLGLFVTVLSVTELEENKLRASNPLSVATPSTGVSGWLKVSVRSTSASSSAGMAHTPAYSSAK